MALYNIFAQYIMHMWTIPEIPLQRINNVLTRAEETKYLSEYRFNSDNKPLYNGLLNEGNDTVILDFLQ